MEIKGGEMGNGVKKACSEDLPSFQPYGASGMVQIECFYAAQLARRMEKSTVTGTSWRTGGYPGGELFSARCSIWEKLTTLNMRPGVGRSRFSRREGRPRRWRCFPMIVLLRSMTNRLL